MNMSRNTTVRREFERCYNFTQLAVELNEMEEGVAPTDSRHRPDQRLMELGEWERANQMKMDLEDKQRASRKRRDSVIEEAAVRGMFTSVRGMLTAVRGMLTAVRGMLTAMGGMLTAVRGMLTHYLYLNNIVSKCTILSSTTE